MPASPKLLRRRRKPKAEPSLGAQKLNDDRTYRQIETYYHQQGYTPQNIERLAEEDLQLIKALQGRRKGRKPLTLTGMSN